jgi:hypothetical protein
MNIRISYRYQYLTKTNQPTKSSDQKNNFKNLLCNHFLHQQRPTTKATTTKQQEQD